MTLSSKSRWNRSYEVIVIDESGENTRQLYLSPHYRSHKTVFYDNREYQLVQGDTWTSLAFRFLGDSYLWWVLCDWNQIVDPRADLKRLIAEAATIKIPSINRMNFNILS